MSEMTARLASATWWNWSEIIVYEVPGWAPESVLGRRWLVDQVLRRDPAAGGEMLRLHRDLLVALVTAGRRGEIVSRGRCRGEVVVLAPEHWERLAVQPASVFRAVDLGADCLTLWPPNTVETMRGTLYGDCDVIEDVTVAWSEPPSIVAPVAPPATGAPRRGPGRPSRGAEIRQAYAELTADERAACRSQRALYRLIQTKAAAKSGLSHGLQFDAIRRALAR